MYYKLKIIFVILLLSVVIFNAPKSYATVYLNLNAEEGTVGAVVPQSIFHQDDPPQTPYGGARATYQSSGGVPQGSKYYQWQTVDNQLDAYTEIFIPGGPITNIMGKTIYLAYFLRFDRINGLDIWHECTVCQSADKGMFLYGDGLRWEVSQGQWDHHAANQDHHFTIWQGRYNAYNLNPGLSYVQNQNGYSPSNPIQLEYEKWHSIVQVVKVASDNTGSLTIYVNGIKISEYTNIQTAAHSSPTITDLRPNGTFAQPAYDSPAHYIKYDAFILTDNWQDIVDGGYLSSNTPPPSGGNPPPNNSGSDTSASGGSGCGFVKEDGKGQEAKGEGLAMMIKLIIALAGIAVLRKTGGKGNVL